METQLEITIRKQSLLNLSIEFGSPTESDLTTLQEFFPTVNIRKIYEVEHYHNKLSNILSLEFEKEKAQLDDNIKNLENDIQAVIQELSKTKFNNSFSKEFLNRHSELTNKINLIQSQIDAFNEEDSLSEAKKFAKEALDSNVRKILDNIAFQLNTKMYAFNADLYKESRNAPKISFRSYSSYEFFTPKDTGTGTNFKGLLLLDIAILYLSSLPAIAHDSLLFKNIDDEGIDGILKIYDRIHEIEKQVFIAFDKQQSYTNEAYSILEKNKVLQLYSGGGELYGHSWNRDNDT